MKPLFFTGMLLIASASAVSAQQTTVTATVKTQVNVIDGTQASQSEVKRTFLSNINKLDAFTGRESTTQADEAYNALVAAMKTDIDKSAGKPTLAEKQKLFGDIQVLANDKQKNRTEIRAKLQDFHKLME